MRQHDRRIRGPIAAGRHRSPRRQRPDSSPGRHRLQGGIGRRVGVDEVHPAHAGDAHRMPTWAAHLPQRQHLPVPSVRHLPGSPRGSAQLLLDQAGKANADAGHVCAICWSSRPV